jgi:hypothetical protein
VDSLCVVQNDTGEWIREAPRMDTIFERGVFTIAALGAENRADGLFYQGMALVFLLPATESVPKNIRKFRSYVP